MVDVGMTSRQNDSVHGLRPRDVARLTALEWSAVAVARHDPISTLSEPSRMAKAMGTVFGRSDMSTRLADEHLEAVRRAAVYAWHGARALPDEEDLAFRSAGFSAAHYDLLLQSTAASTVNTDRFGSA
jgi:hypothetical protein